MNGIFIYFGYKSSVGSITVGVKKAKGQNL